MKRLTFILTVLIAVTLVALPGQAPAKEKVISLKLTHHLGPTHLIARGINEGFSSLEKMSGGRVKVRIFPAGSLAKGREALDAILGGVADLGQVTPPYFAGRFPLLTATTLPGMFSSALIGTQATNMLSNTTPYLKEEFKDLKILSFYLTAPYRLMTKKKVGSLDDIKGMRLRSAGGSQTKTLEHLGATTVLMGSGEVYTSLDRGLLDGAPYTLASIPPYRFYEIAKYILDNAIFDSIPMVLVMNKKSWGKLPPDIQAMVQECANHAAMRVAAYYDGDSKLAVPFLRSKGVEFYNWPDAEEKKFYATLAPLRDKWLADMKAKGLPGKEVLDALLKITAKLSTRWK